MKKLNRASLRTALCRNTALCAIALLALPGCGTTDGGGGVYYSNFDGVGGDGSLGDGSTSADATQDGALGDAAHADAGQSDIALADAAPADTKGADAAVDTGPADTGPADTGPKDAGPADTGPADTGPNCTKTDYTKVQAILTQNCNGCHGHQFGTSCGSATGEKSQIKSKISGGSMPPGGFGSSADKALVLKWISDGATCTPPAGCP